mmetsp:Transcript_9921/g.27112  ORF Transcript_9921/g.27112 Transcript_9921/m.27112 type:complete len:370 (-) Transcript_9921:303-1412(-)
MAETKQVPGDAAAEGSRDDSYDAPPLVSTQTVFAIGIFVYILASIWPPSLLILTVFVWKLTTYSLRINDEGASRRMLLHEFEKNDKVSDHLREIPSDVSVTQGYWTNSRGMLLHTTTITPKDVPVKAVMCHCHGYAENACYTKLRLFSTLAQRGIAVLMIAYEGHGRSDGHLTLVADFDVLVNDVATYYLQTIKKLFPDVKAFLMGESMGGAVAFHILQEHAGVFAGVAFICPMCKIADNMMPPQWVVDSVRLVAGPKGVVNALGYLPIAPSRGDLKFLSFKLPEKKALFTRSPTVFGRNPRIATGREMIVSYDVHRVCLFTFPARTKEHDVLTHHTDSNQRKPLNSDQCLFLPHMQCHRMPRQGSPNL